VCLVWKPNELRQALMPTLEKLYRLEPESLPFRQAVDPILLQIPVTEHCVHIIIAGTIHLTQQVCDGEIR